MRSNTFFILLKCFLDELEIPIDVDKINDRLYAQKAVYLGQLTGCDLGYDFGWHIYGPYCPALTNDYFEMCEWLASGGAFKSMGKRLRHSFSEKLAKAKPLMAPPPLHPHMSLPEWLSLLAKLDFLIRRSGYSHSQAATMMMPSCHLDEVESASKALEGFKARLGEEANNE